MESAMNEEIPEARKVPIQPVDCLTRGGHLLSGDYLMLTAVSFVGVLIGSIPLLQGPMFCGIYLCLRDKERGEPVRFERLFKGFDYFVPSLIVWAMLFGITMLVYIPFYIVMMAGMIGAGVAHENGAEAGMGLGLFVFGVCYAGMLALMLGIFCAFAYAYMLIVDRGLDGVQAVKASARAFLRNPAGTIGLAFLQGLVSVVAAMACFIPLIFVAPVLFGAWWVAYRKLFPASEATTASAADAW